MHHDLNNINYDKKVCILFNKKLFNPLQVSGRMTSYYYSLHSLHKVESVHTMHNLSSVFEKRLKLSS